jgi:hypothetical protein
MPKQFGQSKKMGEQAIGYRFGPYQQVEQEDEGQG